MSFGNVPPAHTLGGASSYYTAAAAQPTLGVTAAAGTSSDGAAPHLLSGSSGGPPQAASAYLNGSSSGAVPSSGANAALPPKPPLRAFSVEPGPPGAPRPAPPPPGRPRPVSRGGAATPQLLQRARRAPYESLDYEVVENTVYRAEYAATSHLDHIQRSAAKWSMCFLLGLITAAASFAVNYGVENISGLKFRATLTLLASGRPGASYALYVAVNAGLVLAAVCLTTQVAPQAAGSGIAEVKAYLNGIDVPGIFLLRTLLVKLTGSVGAVAGGLAVGKEGPFVHAGACIGALLSQGGPSGLAPAWFRRFWNDRDRADLVACGSAAGVAAAFRSPVGGVLFALEETTTWWRNQLLWYAFFTTAVVSVAVRVFMKACVAEENCGFFGSGGLIYYEIVEGQDGFETYELLPMLLLGVIGGLAGSAFNAANQRLAEWRQRRLAGRGARVRVVEALLICVLTSTISFALPLMAGCQICPADSGENCPRPSADSSGNFVPFACPTTTSHYNDLATLFFNTQDDAIRNLFSSKTKAEYSVGTLITFATTFFLLALVSYGTALPTGLFVPGILCGAAYGRLVGVFVADMHPRQTIDEGTYALLGAASFLGGSMRLTVCTCVMLLELTNNLSMLPLVMLVLLVAKAVGDGTGVKPIYESLMDTKHLPYLDPTPDGLMRHITAAEACGRPAVCFQRVERVALILDTLRATRHSAFPVVTESPEGGRAIMGIVLRSHLMVLLGSGRAFQPSPFPSEAASRVAFSYTQAEFTAPISEPAPSVASLRLSEEQLALYLDLGPYVNGSYYVVQEDASLSKVYTLFRTLGLRHLAVIPRATEVRGIITRSDLLPGQLEERFAAGEDQQGLLDGYEAGSSGRGGGGYGGSGGGYWDAQQQQQQQQSGGLRQQQQQQQQQQQGNGGSSGWVAGNSSSGGWAGAGGAAGGGGGGNAAARAGDSAGGSWGAGWVDEEEEEEEEDPSMMARRQTAVRNLLARDRFRYQHSGRMQ